MNRRTIGYIVWFVSLLVTVAWVLGRPPKLRGGPVRRPARHTTQWPLARLAISGVSDLKTPGRPSPVTTSAASAPLSIAREIE